ncbi:MAG: hypothetical protein QG604_717 [Candidatus Dependentiae bacterium]|nr:hypothetical protein [Candidatus Dependentiae bacterium]
MILLIDAYNVVRFLYPGDRQAYEAQVNWFLSKLSAYRKAKRDEIQEIRVVFDGGLFLHKTREIIGGLVVIYAGARRKADDVLVQYAQDLREKGLLISNDRELQQRVAVHRGAAMGVHEFWGLVQSVCAQQEESAATSHRYGEIVITKLENDVIELEDMPEGIDVDSLMIEASVSGVGKKEDSVTKLRTNKGSLSKQEKARISVRKKLG